MTKTSGILVHITSLPNPFGIGDMGPCSYKFIDQLKSAKQTYWQILPINFPDKSASPYSSISAFAANPYLISPELLGDKGYLKQDEIESYKKHIADKDSDSLEYAKVKKIKRPLLFLAYERFKLSATSELMDSFVQFQTCENYWLSPFAHFAVLTEELGEKWWHWPEDHRSPSASQLSLENQKQAEFHKWLQFEFVSQWKALKDYAHSNNVLIIGDIPIFVSHHSSDVWNWKEGFQVNQDGTLKLEAGVPPDQFSSDGQKWSMPTYRWDQHHQNDFHWWRERIKKQYEFYDLIRLDHFIGFHHLFNIPPEDQNAKNGEWVPTPGKQLLQHFLNEYQGKGQPFIAEDLGELTEEVNQLRESFNLPSMKLLQFGFWKPTEKDTPKKTNDHHPDNISSSMVYYTGTHDTSTLKGWLSNLSLEETEMLESYFRKPKKDLNAFHFLEALYQAPAQKVIVPIQDLFFLDDEHRFNVPGTENGNWKWRIQGQTLYHKQENWNQLMNLTLKTSRSHVS